MEYLTVQETAELLRVAPGTVRRWVGQGRLPHLRIGQTVRIPKEEIGGMVVTSEPVPSYVAMSREEREAYAEALIAQLRKTRARIREECGKLTNSVEVLAQVRARDDEDE